MPTTVKSEACYVSLGNQFTNYLMQEMQNREDQNTQ